MTAFILAKTPPHGHTGPALVTGDDSLDTISIVIAGHSHRKCHLEALVRDAKPGVGVFSNAVVDKGYWRSVAKASHGRTVAIVYQGNQHNASFMFEQNGGFDFIASDSVDANTLPDRPIVPEEIVRSHFNQTLDGLREAIGIVWDGGAKRIIISGTPAPHSSADEMRPFLTIPGFFSRYAAAIGMDVTTIPITDLKLRLKLWRLLQRQMKELAADTGCDFLPVPKKSLKKDGSLKRQFRADDATHANADYGAIALAEIISKASHVPSI